MNDTKRINRSDAQWARLIKQFNASGLSQLAFCKQHNVNVYSFRRRYQRSEQFVGKRREPTKAAFAEVALSAPVSGVVIYLSDRLRLECPADMSVEVIAALTKELAHDA